MSVYLSSFFSLPVRRASGVMLSHEEVINQLDNETVAYKVRLGVSTCFTNVFRVSIEVEIAHYEIAIAWLKDLVYGADFNRDRYISDKKVIHFYDLPIVQQAASRSGQDTAISSRKKKRWGDGTSVIMG
jgi:hypothetical protein